MAGMVEMSPQTHPQTQIIKAKNDRMGLSHSKQDLRKRKIRQAVASLGGITNSLYKRPDVDEEHYDLFEPGDVAQE